MSKDILKLSESSNSVLTYWEIYSIIEANTPFYKKRKIDLYEKKWILNRIVKWFYCLNWRKYNKFELVNKMYSPSYISLFSALYKHKMIFQLPESVFLIYTRTFEKYIDNTHIVSKRLKEDILLNIDGLVNKDNYTIACPERALLDTIYFYWETYIDNLDMIDWDKTIRLSKIYNKKTQTIVKSYISKL